MDSTFQIRDISTKIRTFSQKKNVLIVASGLLIGATALMVTNPGESAYVDYAAERLAKTSQQSCDELNGNLNLLSLFSLPTRDFCKSFWGNADLMGRGAVKLAIKTTTEPKNLGILSIYTTQAFGRTVKTVGIGGNFITFYAK